MPSKPQEQPKVILSIRDSMSGSSLSISGSSPEQVRDMFVGEAFQELEAAFDKYRGKPTPIARPNGKPAFKKKVEAVPESNRQEGDECPECGEFGIHFVRGGNGKRGPYPAFWACDKDHGCGWKENA